MVDDSWLTGDVITKSRMNKKTVFVDTGANINAYASPPQGMEVYCTTSGSGFYAKHRYEFDGSVWREIGSPIGSMELFGGAYNAIPNGWLICDGTAVSRTTYDGLFAIIGTRYGVGDGSTTFNVPDYRATFPRGAPNATSGGGTGGADTVAISEAQLAIHTHVQNSHTHTIVAGGESAGGTHVNQGLTGTSATTDATTAVNQNDGSGSAHENRPAYLESVVIIKT